MRAFKVRNAVASRLMRPTLAQALAQVVPPPPEEPRTPQCLQYTSIGEAPRIEVRRAPPPDGSKPPKGFMIPEAPFVVDYGSQALGDEDRRRAGPFTSMDAAKHFAVSDARIDTPGQDGWYRVIDCLGRTVELACSECALGGR